MPKRQPTHQNNKALFQRRMKIQFRGSAGVRGAIDALGPQALRRLLSCPWPSEALRGTLLHYQSGSHWVHSLFDCRCCCRSVVGVVVVNSRGGGSSSLSSYRVVVEKVRRRGTPRMAIGRRRRRWGVVGASMGRRLLSMGDLPSLGNCCCQNCAA